MTPPTRSTPGMARSRSASSLAKFARLVDVRYLRNCRGALNVTTFRASNPGSTRWIWTKLRTINPAPIRSTSDSATSSTTNALRSLLPRRPPVSLPRSRSASARLPATARSAGASPNRIAATHAAPAVYRSAARSMAASSIRGKLPGLKAVMSLMPCHARSTPSTAPAHESTALSTSICAMIRPRPLPTAARTAISRPRSVALTSSRFAMLAHAISSTNPTAPRRASRAGRAWLTTSRCIPFTLICRFWVLWNWWTSRSRAATASISCCACSSVTPSRSRVTTVSQGASRAKSEMLMGSTPQASTFVGIPASAGR